MCQAGSGKYQAASAATLIAAQVKRECSRRQKVIDAARRPTPRAADAKTTRPFDANRILPQRKNIFALMGAEPWIIRALQAEDRLVAFRQRTRRPKDRSTALRPQRKGRLAGRPHLSVEVG